MVRRESAKLLFSGSIPLAASILRIDSERVTRKSDQERLVLSCRAGYSAVFTNSDTTMDGTFEETTL